MGAEGPLPCCGTARAVCPAAGPSRPAGVRTLAGGSGPGLPSPSPSPSRLPPAHGTGRLEGASQARHTEEELALKGLEPPKPFQEAQPPRTEPGWRPRSVCPSLPKTTGLVTGSSDCCIVKVALEWSGVGGAATGRKSDS